MTVELEDILSEIDNHYSKVLQLKQLKFLAQAVVPLEHITTCNSVPEVYWKINTRLGDNGKSTALLRHMLRVTGYNNESELRRLSAHCCNDFDLYTVAPTLSFYELLLILARKLQSNNTYTTFLNCVDQSKLNKSKHDLLQSPLELFQSMIYRGTIDPKEPSTLLGELANPLIGAGLGKEAKFIETSVVGYECEQSDTRRTYAIVVLYNFEGQLQSRSSQTSGGSVQIFSEKSMKELQTDPLLPSVYKTRSSTKETHLCYRIFGVCNLCFIVVTFVALLTMVFYMMVPTHNDIQHVYYLDLVFSPFTTINPSFAINRLEVEFNVNDDDSCHHELTVCQSECPLRTETNVLNFSRECKAGLRRYKNCFAKLNVNSSDSFDSRVQSVYMLKNSTVTFRLLEPNITGPVHVCVTIDPDRCNTAVYYSNTTVCHQIIPFNETNNYTGSFVARADGYYCTVWLLQSKNQGFNYETELRTQIYNMTDFKSTLLCKTFKVLESSKCKAIYNLRGYPRLGQLDVCAVFQVGGSSAPNFTVTTRELKMLSNGTAIVLTTLVGIVMLICIILLVVTCGIACHERVARSRY